MIGSAKVASLFNNLEIRANVGPVDVALADGLG
jgi:hypothetical protein